MESESLKNLQQSVQDYIVSLQRYGSKENLEVEVSLIRPGSQFIDLRNYFVKWLDSNPNNYLKIRKEEITFLESEKVIQGEKPNQVQLVSRKFGDEISRYKKYKKPLIKIRPNLMISVAKEVEFENEYDPIYPVEQIKYTGKYKSVMGDEEMVIPLIIDIKTRNVDDPKPIGTIEIEFPGFETFTQHHLNIINFLEHEINIVMTKSGKYISYREKYQLALKFNKIFDPNNNYSTYNTRNVNKPIDFSIKSFSKIDFARSPTFFGINQDQGSFEALKSIKFSSSSEPFFSIEGGYFVSLKADGTRRILFAESKVLYSLNVFLNQTTYVCDLEENISFVLDAEQIGEIDIRGNPVSGKWKFLVFDVLSFGKNNTTELYAERMKFAEKAIRKIKAENFTAEIKPIYPVSENPFELFLDLISKRKVKTGDISWENDGLIFTPAKATYIPKGHPMNTKGTLTFKWKPKRLLTIDLMIYKSIKTLLAKGTQSELSEILSYWNGNILLREDMIDKIYEFRWDQSEEFDGEFGFVPVRERPDKRQPNSDETIKSVWRSIFSGFDEDVLSGKSLKLMRVYHQKVKKSIISSLSHNSVHLDIGSGAGGDLFSFKVLASQFKKIYSIEPDQKNAIEFLKRLYNKSSDDKTLIDVSSNNNKGRSRINFINAEGQETFLIIPKIQEEVQSVTMFNVLTFFDPDSIDFFKLMRTITKVLKRDIGTFDLIVFDGKKLMSYLGEKKFFSTRNLQIKVLSEKKIYIKLKGSIVRGQEEFLIDTKILKERIKSFGFRCVTEYYLNEEEMMSDEEKWLSSLYKVMRFSYDGKNFVQHASDFSELKNIEKEIFEETKIMFAALSIPDSFSKISDDIFRISVNSDSSSFLNAVLLACNDSYQKSDLYERQKIVRSVREKENWGNVQKFITREQFGEIAERIGINILITKDLKEIERYTGENREKWVVLEQIGLNHFEIISKRKGDFFITCYDEEPEF